MYNVSVSPHVRDKSSTKSIMRDVAIALVPTLAFGVYQFGWNALLLIAISVLSCVGFEALYELLAKKPITVFDYSAVVTGLILAVNLPPTAEWWMPILGSAFAIIVVKMLFGGLGQNFMNPALAGRAFLAISFAQRMTNFAVDGYSGATPLAVLKEGKLVDIKDVFLGFQSGCIGEVSALAILIGAAYLVIRRVISLRIPLTYIISTIAIIGFIKIVQGTPLNADFGYYLLGELLSGGLLVGAFFMATDYVSSPVTVKGQIVFGLIIGLLTALFRTLGQSAEGVSYAILIGNLLVPLIENRTVPRAFGCEREKWFRKLIKEGEDDGKK
ncbi:MAG: RnfABCDGE type electron transport complex subunit D [Ruminococcaceae bacterium]|nr:RnfABCDGE type electron transport complex subunit D [Oscillospiraceae bacterium]